MRFVKRIALTVLFLGGVFGAQAAEVGHYSPGPPNIRDFFVPPPGIYGVIYNYLYTSTTINDQNGDEIRQITIGMPPQSATLDLDIDLDLTVVTPGVMWSSKWKVLGARYGAYALMPFANTSLGASLTTQTGSGRDVEASQFALGDVFLQPVWLGWTRPHWEVALGYGLYAPIGKYDTEEITLPVVGKMTVEATDNIGLGFWTHQLQGACSWYPWPDRRMAVAGALTWEVHGEKKDFDLTPGQNLALNWGVSQYMPLKQDRTLILEFGPAGYDSWQVSDDSGDRATNPSVHDGVHAIGLQVGTIHVPWHLSVSFRYLNEYDATDRFQGQSFGLSVAKGF